MKWSIENLQQLRAWLLDIKDGDEIVVPDFLAMVSITKYQEKLKDRQGEHFYNSHFTDEVLEEILKSSG